MRISGNKTMNESKAHVQHQTVLGKRTYARWVGLLALLVSSLALATPVLAQHTLQDVGYQKQPGGQVELHLEFDSVPPVPTAFTTEEPPRIALDFGNTNNTVPERNIDINVGSTSGVTVVSAEGRTRVVIDLIRASSYRTHREGNTLVVAVANGKVDPSKAQNYAGNNPAKAPPPTGVRVSDIGFRRGPDGAGKVIVSFSGPGAVADLETGNGEVIVTLSHVDLPDKFAKHLDVTDFATPVRFIETRPVRGGAKLHIETAGNVATSAFRTGTKYVVTLSPVKAEPVADSGKAVGPNGLPRADYSGERVTFNFQNIPVRQVLYLIAGESDFNIVVDDSVGGSITLRLKNVPWSHALDLVLRAKGLAMRKRDNVIWVAPQPEIAAREQARAEARRKRAHNSPLQSVYIPLSYAKAKDIAALMTEKSKQAGGGGGGGEGGSRGFLSPRGSVSYDVRTNTLLVKDTAAKIREIRQMVAKLDRPVKQVLIEARIVVATDDFARQLGVRFGITGAYEDGDGNVITTSGTLDGADSMIGNAAVNRRNTGVGLPVTIPPLPSRLNVNLPSGANPAGSFGLAILGADYLLDLELSAAQTEGKSQIISTPRVITANQQTAVISQGQEIAYQTITTSQGGGQLPTVQFKEATLKLEVTPTITNDGRVFLNLNVRKDSLAGFYQSATGRLPIIDTRYVQTQVLVDNGATVVLGGILEVTQSEDVTKVPLLGDIPVLGYLFRQTSTSNNRAELLIFVTPRILSKRLD